MEKVRTTTTIEVSIATHLKLYRIKEQIEKIINKRISYDKALQIILASKSLDTQLMELTLE